MSTGSWAAISPRWARSRRGAPARLCRRAAGVAGRRFCLSRVDRQIATPPSRGTEVRHPGDQANAPRMMAGDLHRPLGVKSWPLTRCRLGCPRRVVVSRRRRRYQPRPGSVRPVHPPIRHHLLLCLRGVSRSAIPLGDSEVSRHCAADHFTAITSRPATASPAHDFDAPSIAPWKVFLGLDALAVARAPPSL